MRVLGCFGDLGFPLNNRLFGVFGVFGCPKVKIRGKIIKSYGKLREILWRDLYLRVFGGVGGSFGEGFGCLLEKVLEGFENLNRPDKGFGKKGSGS